MDTENRFIELETKVAHQEMAIDELQTHLHEQSLLIDRLEKSLKVLKDKLEAANSAPAPVERPPHY